MAYKTVIQVKGHKKDCGTVTALNLTQPCALLSKTDEVIYDQVKKLIKYRDTVGHLRP